MGTNYYHRTAICPCCNRYDERHICKSMTNFRGYRRPTYLPSDKPFEEIMSWADWKRIITAGGEVWDEYGAQVPTEDFIRYVEAKPARLRRRQYDWVWDNLGTPEMHGYWLDLDGFSFYDGEFC